MSLSILGIKGKSLLNQLLDILELDSSIFVRIQVMHHVILCVYVSNFILLLEILRAVHEIVESPD